MKSDSSFLRAHTVQLLPPTEDDIRLSDWHNWYNNQQLTQYNSHGIYPVTPQDEVNYVLGQNRTTTIILAIECIQTKKIIGNAALQNIDLINRHCNIAITLGGHHGISAGVEVYGLLLNHAFNRLNLHRVEDACHEQLEPFVKMLGVLGVEKEFVSKDYFLRDGHWSDRIHFSVLADNFRKLALLRNGNILYESYEDLLSAIVNSVRT